MSSRGPNPVLVVSASHSINSSPRRPISLHFVLLLLSSCIVLLPMPTLSLLLLRAVPEASAFRVTRSLAPRRYMTKHLSGLVHVGSRYPSMGSLFIAAPHRLMSLKSSPAPTEGTNNACASAACATTPSSLNDTSISAGVVSPAPLRNYFDMSPEDVRSLLGGWGVPAYREAQLRNWAIEKGVTNPEEMNDLPASLRLQLSEALSFGSMEVAAEQVSRDGTIKRAYRLRDGQLIESVLMPYADGRQTACISSQVGCGMRCAFCATGQMGFFRQLSATEIFEQAQHFSAMLRQKGKRLSNVVMMGMGEPMANYDNVLSAVRRMVSDLGIGSRHITISTVGIVPRIKKLAHEDLQCGLAISLHQANDAARSALMPVNNRYPIAELLDACRYYCNETNRRISFEWALISGVTDTPQTARELGALLQGILCHVNLIPLNPTPGFNGTATSREGVAEFVKILATYGITATPRMRKGIDISAGCGQLRTELTKRTGKSDAGRTSE